MNSHIVYAGGALLHSADGAVPTVRMPNPSEFAAASDVPESALRVVEMLDPSRSMADFINSRPEFKLGVFGDEGAGKVPCLVLRSSYCKLNGGPGWKLLIQIQDTGVSSAPVGAPQVELG